MANHKTHVGAGLLAKASVQPILMGLTYRIREQARSHSSFVSTKKYMANHKSTVGASLLAMRPTHPTSRVTDTPPSLAGQLPQ